MKFALISHVLPPSWSGQSMVIYQLLRDFSPESYCLISWQAEGIGGDPTPYLRALPGRRYQIPPEFQIQRGYRFGARNVDIALAILQRARYLTRVLRREGCDLVVACTGDVLDLPASYLASRRLGIPLYAYIFDHYSKRECVDPTARAWAKRLEPRLLKGAAEIIVPCETLRDDLLEDYGVEATVIHNSCDISAYETDSADAALRGDDGIKIVYTGDIYDAHYDAFRNLLKAVESLDRPDVKLHLYTARPAEVLDHYGIRGLVVRHPHRQPSEVPGIQQAADILFLPLAFDSPYPDVIRTSATTKLGEYLAARRPVLVHAPRDSFVSWYFREHRCGMVVDRNDPAALAEAVARLLDDEGLGRGLVARGWERARADFDIEAARAKFTELVGRERG
ncbi:MAG TPA: glycosyltransferase [Pyrinomonadaceae bacterium]|nr:glycosyltransferase [Pyrinomonadaceae bacterium]